MVKRHGYLANLTTNLSITHLVNGEQTPGQTDNGLIIAPVWIDQEGKKEMGFRRQMMTWDGDANLPSHLANPRFCSLLSTSAHLEADSSFRSILQFLFFQ